MSQSEIPAAVNATTPSTSTLGSNAGKAPSFVPPRRAWVTVGICLTLAVLSQLGLNRVLGELADRAASNVVSLIFCFIAFMRLLTWFVFRSSYPALVRRLVGLTILGLVVFGVATISIDETTGNLVPSKIRFRWMKKTDQNIASIETPAKSTVIDLSTESESDYPEFLGRGRRNALTGINLAKDWANQPPKLLWKQPIGAGWSSFSVVNGYAVTMEQRGEDELTTCYELRTGKLVWAHREAARHETVLGGVGPRSTPTIHEGRVYTLGAQGIVVCLEGATGKLLWRFDLLAERGSSPERDPSVVAWGRSGSPLIVDNLVVGPAGGPAKGQCVSLIALDKLTGEKVWEAGDRQVSYCSPILVEDLVGKRQIVSVNEDNVSGHEPQTGKVIWEYPWFGNSAANANTSQPIPLPGNQLLVSKSYGAGAMLLQLSDAGNGKLEAKEVWHNNRVLKTKFTNLTIHQGYGYGLSDGILECVDLETGRSRWKKGRYDHGQVLRVDDMLLVLSEAGELALVDASPQAYFEHGKIPALEGKTWNNLCLIDHLLLIRNGQEAACYELP
ncbi:MAG: PQQ-binding-like beta-propeller repeat protein [Planctomycetota bacterium]